MVRAAEQVDFLRNCLLTSQLVRDLEPATTDALARLARIEVHADGAPVQRRDEVMTFSGVIVSGGIQSSITSPDGYVFSVSIMRRGAFFGSLGLLESTPSVWDCRAFGETQMVTVRNRDFQALMPRHPDLVMLLAKANNYRLRKAYAMMANVVLDSLDRRLRRMLLMLIEAPGDGNAGAVPEIAITQEVLGQFVKGSRPSVNKALRSLERAGIIEIRYGLIRVLDAPALRHGFENEVFLVM